MTFDGETFDQRRDGPRLQGHLERVYFVLSDHQWHRLVGLARRSIGSEAGTSARLRDLRKPKFGGHIIERRYARNGIWEYRLAAPGDWTETKR